MNGWDDRDGRDGWWIWGYLRRRNTIVKGAFSRGKYINARSYIYTQMSASF